MNDLRMWDFIVASLQVRTSMLRAYVPGAGWAPMGSVRRYAAGFVGGEMPG